MDVHEKGSSQYAHLQQLLGTARQQVQALQGDLADSNAVVIHSVTGTPAATVQQEAQQLRQQNADRKRKVDAVYAERAGEARHGLPHLPVTALTALAMLLHKAKPSWCSSSEESTGGWRASRQNTLRLPGEGQAWLFWCERVATSGLKAEVIMSGSCCHACEGWATSASAGKQRQTRETQARVQELQASLEEKLGQLAPAAKQQYFTLQASRRLGPQAAVTVV